jgi:hypothetical protein
MRRRIANINDLSIGVDERRFHWLLGRRSDGHPGSPPLELRFCSGVQGACLDAMPTSRAICSMRRLSAVTRAKTSVGVGATAGGYAQLA